jgi:hypothetical protein
MNRPRKSLSHALTASLIAVTFVLSAMPLALAAPGDINSTNNGQVVQGGNYYNTADSKTTFVNTGSGGLWVKSGVLVRGLEVLPDGSFTGNGGTLHFFAPGSVVRIDGSIDVSGILRGGVYTGNGGRVIVDSAFLYQNGSIFANGRNGGMVQFNTGTAVFGPNAIVEAKGFGYGTTGGGGIININASDIVDVQQGALIDSSGQVLAGIDNNIINVEASLINVEGVLRANGTVLGGDGGTIRLVAHGDSSNCFGCTLDSVRVFSNNVNGLPIAEDVFSQTEAQNLIARRDALINGSDGSILVARTAHVTADGHSGAETGNGGAIFMVAATDVINDGFIMANGGTGNHETVSVDGGDGGMISLSAMDDIINTCHILANGGNGGNDTTT